MNFHLADFARKNYAIRKGYVILQVELMRNRITLKKNEKRMIWLLTASKSFDNIACFPTGESFVVKLFFDNMVETPCTSSLRISFDGIFSQHKTM